MAHIQEINNKGYIISISQDINEPDNIFFDRLFFISKNFTPNSNIPQLIKFSKIYSNIKYYNCKYPPHIYHIIHKMM